MNNVLLIKILNRHILNILIYYNAFDKIHYNNTIIEALPDDDLINLISMIDRTKFTNISRKYDNYTPNMDDTIKFISNLGKPIFVELLGNILYDEIIEDLTKVDTIVTFESFYNK